jgi:hypothetical protein
LRPERNRGTGWLIGVNLLVLYVVWGSTYLAIRIRWWIRPRARLAHPRRTGHLEILLGGALIIAAVVLVFWGERERTTERWVRVRRSG